MEIISDFKQTYTEKERRKMCYEYINMELQHITNTTGARMTTDTLLKTGLLLEIIEELIFPDGNTQVYPEE